MNTFQQHLGAALLVLMITIGPPVIESCPVPLLPPVVVDWTDPDPELVERWRMKFWEY